jgi:hypothetical protein
MERDQQRLISSFYPLSQPVNTWRRALKLSGFPGNVACFRYSCAVTNQPHLLANPMNRSLDAPLSKCKNDTHHCLPCPPSTLTSTVTGSLFSLWQPWFSLGPCASRFLHSTCGLTLSMQHITPLTRSLSHSRNHGTLTGIAWGLGLLTEQPRASK